jgi:RimJ/RimL family protein N-acetyltransferase
MNLVSARLELVPYTPAQLLALLDAPERFQAVGGIAAADGLREFFTSGDVSAGYLAALRAAPGPDPWTLGFAVVHRGEGLVIGNAGCTGPPDERGQVEIAYGIVPGFQGQGYAKEAAASLVRFTLADPRVHRLIAHTLPESNASTHVLTRLGFQFDAEVTLPADGKVWRWKRER